MNARAETRDGITIAAVQFKPPKGDPDRARPLLMARIDAALSAGATLVVCPEMATTGYVFDDARAIRPFAERPTGPTFQAVAKLARRARARIVVGFVEDAGDALYNSAMLVGPDGELEAVYRKILLFELDQNWAAQGARRVVVQTEMGRVAPGICMDLNDDGFTAFLSREAPRVVTFCTNWLEQGFDVVPYWQWRLAGWRGWFVAANTWGEDEGIRFSGRSAILAPGGVVAAIAGRSGDEVILVEGAR